MKNNNQYAQRLRPILIYLEENFDKKLNLEDVAHKAHISPYHFHRVFKSVTGETFGNYLRRLKLEHAVHQLFHQKTSVTKVALDLNFSSSQSLAKALKTQFGFTATDVLQCQNLPELKQLLKNSKIGHLLSNFEYAIEFQKSDDMTSSTPKERLFMKTQKVAEKSLAYIRITGEYGTQSAIIEQSVQTLYQWAGTQGFNIQDLECIFIYHDNPSITPATQCRTDICLSIPKDSNNQNDREVIGSIAFQIIPEGGYAVRRFNVVDKTGFAKHWDDLVSDVVKSDLTLAERPCFEIYHSYDGDTGAADLSIYVAVD